MNKSNDSLKNSRLSYYQSADSPIKKIMIGNSLDQTKTLDLAMNDRVHHVLEETSIKYKKELEFSHYALDNTQAFLDSPLSAVFSNTEFSEETDSSKLQTLIEFNSSSQKEEIISKTCEFAKLNKIRRHVFDNIRLACDELFTNAIYNAPIGNSNMKIPRSANVKLIGDKKCKLYLGYDHEQFYIFCKDPFGSLNINAFLNRIRECAVKGAGNVINYDEDSGAGIGSYLMYEMSNTMYVGLNPGKTTVIGYSFITNRSYILEEQPKKTIHIARMDRK